MSLNLTDQQIQMLDVISYIDIDQFYEKDETYLNQSLGQFAIKLKNYKKENRANTIKANGAYTDIEFIELMEKIQRDPVLSNLKFKDYQNNNTASGVGFTGFVAMALEDSDGNKVIVSRGSEGEYQKDSEGAVSPFTTKDWWDNYGLAGKGSTQFKQMEVFTRKNMADPGKSTLVTGHSKGGANALYAGAVIDGLIVRTFDAPGITQLLTGLEIERLKNGDIINYVADGDPVGALLFRAEQVIHVETTASNERKYKYYYIEKTYNELTPKEKLLGGKFYKLIKEDLTLDKQSTADLFNFHYL